MNRKHRRLLKSAEAEIPEALQAAPGWATSKLCDQPEGIVEQEAAFLSALASAGGFGIKGDQLYMSNASGQRLMDLTSLSR